jgi:hypothetical protein
MWGVREKRSRGRRRLTYAVGESGLGEDVAHEKGAHRGDICSAWGEREEGGVGL